MKSLSKQIVVAAGARQTLIAIEDSDEPRMRLALQAAAVAHGERGGWDAQGVAWYWSLVGGFETSTSDTNDEGESHTIYRRNGNAGWEPPRFVPGQQDGSRVDSEAAPFANGMSTDAIGAVFAVIEWGQANPDKPGLAVFPDAHAHLSGSNGDLFCRALRDAADALRSTQISIVLTSAQLRVPGEQGSSGLPPELAADVHVIRPGLPGTDELRSVIEREIAVYDNPEISCSLSDLADACRGGTTAQACDWIAQCYVEHNAIDCTDVQSRKAAALSGIPGLTYENPDDDITDVGGLDMLKAWLIARSRGLSEAARTMGVMLSGLVLAGPPGTGKSLCSRVIASIFGLPLFSFDLGSAMDSFVGNSEHRLQAVLDAAGANAPCVVRLDEVEKVLGGAGDRDGGTTERLKGKLLSFWEESDAPILWVLTANHPSRLPPELLRAGRFDGTWLVDLPNAEERAAILSIHLRKRNCGPLADDGEALARLANAFQGYSGSELEQGVKEAIWIADPDLTGEIPVSEKHLKTSLSAVIPLTTTMGEQINQMREWLKGRARPASTPETTPAPAGAGARRAVARGAAPGAN